MERSHEKHLRRGVRRPRPRGLRPAFAPFDQAGRYSGRILARFLGMPTFAEVSAQGSGPVEPERSIGEGFVRGLVQGDVEAHRTLLCLKAKGYIETAQ
jgi:hypothetical protein